VQSVCGAIHHCAGPYFRDFAITLDFACAFANDEKFFFWMSVRRVRAHAWFENTRTRGDAAELIGGAVVIDENFLPFESERRGGGHVQDAFRDFGGGEFGCDGAVGGGHESNIAKVILDRAYLLAVP